MAGRNVLKERPRCGVLLRDGSACKGAAAAVWNQRCEWHGIAEIGAERGWLVRGGRRAGVYVASRDGQHLVADTPVELVALLKKASKSEWLH
jgi:hypothetical protein